MKLEQQLFMDILRAFAAEESFCLPVIDPDWEELLHLSRIQDTEGIIGYELMHSPHLTPELRDVMHRCFLQTVGTCAKRAGKMAGLVRLMNDRGIEHLLVKGYLVRELYPVPELRTFGDIDFLIHLEDREKCDALLMEEGFQRTVDWEPVYSYVRKDEYYEVHTDIMEVDVSDKADYKGYFSQVWQHAVRQEGYTFVPEIQFHLLYLLTHLAKHITSSGAGIRLYLDIAFYIRRYRDEIDWDAFRQELAVLHLEAFANVVFAAAGQWFGVAAPYSLQPLEPDFMDELLEITLNGGVFGHYNEDRGLTVLKKEDRDSERVAKGSALLHKMFPRAGEIESRYTYLQSRPWLLPAAWLHRFVRTLDRFDEHADEAKKIMNADEEKVLRLRKFYKYMGF